MAKIKVLNLLIPQKHQDQNTDSGEDIDFPTVQPDTQDNGFGMSDDTQPDSENS